MQKIRTKPVKLIELIRTLDRKEFNGFGRYVKLMVKDENVCLHCGLCAERCPTAAWDMQKFTYTVTKAGK